MYGMEDCSAQLQVPPKSRAALQVNEARLALLLQAVRTSLQMQSSSHSFRLAAVDITAQLARCQVKTQTRLSISMLQCCQVATFGCLSDAFLCLCLAAEHVISGQQGSATPILRRAAGRLRALLCLCVVRYMFDYCAC